MKRSSLNAGMTIDRVLSICSGPLRQVRSIERQFLRRVDADGFDRRTCTATVSTGSLAASQGMNGRKLRSPVPAPSAAWRAKSGSQFEIGAEREIEQPHVGFAAIRHRVAFAPLQDANDAAGAVALEVDVGIRSHARRQHQCGALRRARRALLDGRAVVWCDGDLIAPGHRTRLGR